MKRLLLPAVLATLFVGAVAAQPIPPAGQDTSLKGEVLEVQDVDSYTYLRLRTKDGDSCLPPASTPAADSTVSERPKSIARPRATAGARTG